MSKQFILTITELDNDAFQGNLQEEISRLLNKAADKVLYSEGEDLKYYQSILDLNGNPVGSFAIKTKPLLKNGKLILQD